MRVTKTLQVDATKGPIHSHSQNVDHHASGFRPRATLSETVVTGTLRNQANAKDR